ncbi:uncharacterized protein [Triticum aestivum]|uniref:uncharacterized protein n=1 Tax=Triticum aestivum TaxID=4565 RepID=UPI001D01F999|nr:uncharacterized protein LOC123150679 [Triticum aestivum]
MELPPCSLGLGTLLLVKISKEFTLDAASLVETIWSLASTGTRCAMAHLTQLLKTACVPGKENGRNASCDYLEWCSVCFLLPFLGRRSPAALTPWIDKFGRTGLAQEHILVPFLQVSKEFTHADACSVETICSLAATGTRCVMVHLTQLFKTACVQGKEKGRNARVTAWSAKISGAGHSLDILLYMQLSRSVSGS